MAVPSTSKDSRSSEAAISQSTLSLTASSAGSQLGTSTKKTPQPKPKKIRTEQSTIDSFRISASHQEKITDALVYFLAADMRPFAMVEKRGFIRFVKAANPAYKIPSRKTIAEKKIPSLYNSTKEKIMLLLKNEYFYALTTDSWTSNANLPYISVTVHFINDDWELKSICLACRYMSQDQTGENLAFAINEILEEWTIHKQSVISCTTDSGRNILNAIIAHLNLLHIPCFGHVLNLAVKQSFDIEVLATAIEKCKKIQMTFSHSYKINQMLNKTQQRLQLPTKKIPSFSNTRWWSLLDLLRMCSEQHLAIIAVLKDYQKGKNKCYILTQDEVDVLKSTVKTMTFFEEISSNMASEKFITSSCIVPLIQKILRDVLDEHEISDDQDDNDIATEVLFEQSLTTSLIQPIRALLKEKYYNKKDTYNFLKKSMFLDPRFKDNQADVTSIKEDLVEEMKVFIEQTSDDVVPKQHKEGLASIFAKKAQNIKHLTPEDKLNMELKSYENMPELEYSQDPLLWWKERQKNLPCLSRIAKKYLTPPATSVPSERVFSKGGSIVTDERCSLTNEHVEQLIFLSVNNDYL